MKKISLLIPAFLLLCQSQLHAQHLYSIDTIQQIEILFPMSNWDYILDTAKQGSDSYTLSTWVKINGIQFDSVGVKYKGNSSYNPNNLKNPLHIELDHFKDQNYLGIKDIKLSNGYHEPSMVREVLLYQIARQYMPASRCNYAEVIINGSPMGLYTNVESVTKTFLEDRFFSKENTFVFGDNGGCNLMYKGSDTTLYYTPYTMKSDYGWTDLRNLCDTLQNSISNIEAILDVDRTLWMLAFNNVTVTLDSYSGQSTHNYYIYQDHNHRFNPIIWDLNGGLGIFNRANIGPNLTVSQMQQMSPTLHINDAGWPLIKNLLAIPMYKKMYIAHMKTIFNENFADSSYYFNALYLQSIVDAAFQADPTAFYSYTEFINNITQNVIDGPKTIPGITLLMEARKTFLSNTPEFQQIAPGISNIQVSNTSPVLNTMVSITAQVTNGTTVYLGSRHSSLSPFERQLMYDDGLHSDGMAGDGIYGVMILFDSYNLQYYIYAENVNAGSFSPQRAEYEYYSLAAQKGVVINELMADNTVTQTDPYGEYNDWIELYNNSSSAIDLSGYYLSDDVLDAAKWTFPAGTVINAHDFLIVWADDDINQTIGLHSNFKLSAAGEYIILSDTSLQKVDDILFPAINTDITYGRYPNGTGAFTYLNATFNAVNSPTLSVAENIQQTGSNVIVYPNPAQEFLYIKMDTPEACTITIYNQTGAPVYQGTISNGDQIDMTGYRQGMYCVRVNNQVKKILLMH